MRTEVRPVNYPDAKEAAILVALYEAPNGNHSTYTLAQQLHPDAQLGTDDAGKAFAETHTAIEALISKSLVRGARKTGADGVYFEKLKLTQKGERKAIECKNRLTRVIVERIGQPDESEK